MDKCCYNCSNYHCNDGASPCLICCNFSNFEDKSKESDIKVIQLVSVEEETNTNEEVTMNNFVHCSETEAMFMTDSKALNDRKKFVHNLGILMSQTRESIASMKLDDNEIVTVTFNNGHEKYVNVRLDSYTAIIKDVIKQINL